MTIHVYPGKIKSKEVKGRVVKAGIYASEIVFQLTRVSLRGRIVGGNVLNMLPLFCGD